MFKLVLLMCALVSGQPYCAERETTQEFRSHRACVEEGMSQLRARRATTARCDYEAPEIAT